MRRSLVSMLIAVVISGCGSAVAPTGAPKTSSARPDGTLVASTATPTPSSAPGSPTPTLGDGTPVVCPTTLPTRLASIDVLADRSCYGTTELTLDGWLADESIDVTHNEATPSWVMPSVALFASSPTVREFMFTFLFVEQVSHRLELVAKPDSGVDLFRSPRWVTLRGHFNDPEALACTSTTPDTYPDEFAGPDCDRLFVVTALDPLLQVGDECGPHSLTIAEFMAADAACHVGREVELTGWEDVGEGFGGAAPVYGVDLAPSMRFAKAQLVAHRWESDLDHDPIFPWTIAGSGVRFDRSDLRAVVTGMLGHPVAKDCRPATLQGWTWSPPVSWAQHQCEHLFVITDVRNR